MKFLKWILIFISVCLITVYLGLYLLLPYFLNKKDYSKLLTQNIKKQTGLILFIHNYSLSVSAGLDFNLKADEIQLFYPDKKQIANIKKADIHISALYLMKKEIKLTKIKADEFQFSTKLLKNGKTTFQQYIEKNVNQKNNDFTFSKKHPVINIKKYIIKIKDEESNQTFKLSGKNLKARQSLDFHNINIETEGSFYCFNKKYLNYKVKLVIPSVLFENADKTLFDISFDDLYKYDFFANVIMDLKVNEKNKKFTYLSGTADIDDFTLKIGAQKLPPSYFHITLDKGRAKLVSKFYTDKNESTDINANIKLTKPYDINMLCKCKKADISNLQKIAIPVLSILKIKNNLSDFVTKGQVSADFNIKTNLETISSNGSLSVTNAVIYHKSIPLKITGINALVDFSDDSVNIKKSDILVNSQPVKIKGKIDKNAFADILISAQNLHLNHIMNAFSFLKVQENLTILSGTVSFKTHIKGKLADVSPLIQANIKDFRAKENTQNIKVTINEIIINAFVQKDKYKGKIRLKNVLCYSQSIPNNTGSLSTEEISADFDNKNIKINPSKINAGKAKLTLSGDVKSYAKNPYADILMQGSVDTDLLKNAAPKEIRLYAKGYLPIKAQISTDLKNTQLNIKLLANQSNYITPLIIKSFENINTLTNIRARIINNDIFLDDASIYYADSVSSLVKDINPLKLKKAISINGKIDKINSSPKLNDLHITVQPEIEIIIPETKGGSAYISADIKASESIENPSLNGNISVNNLKLPKYFVNAQNAFIRLNRSNISVQINNLKIKDMLISTNIEASPDAIKTNKINYVKISANHIDMDYLMTLMPLLGQSKYAPGSDFPYIISGGDLSIKSYKMGNIKAQNITAKLSSHKNKLFIKHMFSDAYGGKAAGNITYDFPYTSIHADIQGRGMDASQAAGAFMPSEQGVFGRLDFDASVDMMGTTMQQQMKTLKGRADVLIKNGRLGQLGRFEHFLYAQNLLSQKLIYASLNSAKQAVSPKDTGYITYFKGRLKFSGGYAHINPALTSGPQMSMYITGRTNLINNDVDLHILGKISSEVSSSMGVLGTMTIKDFLDSHTKYGPAVANLFNFCNIELPEIDISKIPPLNPDYRYPTKNFQVIISGDPNSVKSVKSFTWVNPPGTKQKVLTQKVKNAINSALPQKNTQEPIKQPTEQDSSTPVIQSRPMIEKTPPQTSQDFLDNIPDNFN